MNHAAYAVNTQTIARRSFSELAKKALWGIGLNVREQVVATHRELAILRRCAKLVNNEPGQVIHLISPLKTQQTNYIVKTLMHFGVSCGQINVTASASDGSDPEGVWLFVADLKAS